LREEEGGSDLNELGVVVRRTRMGSFASDWGARGSNTNFEEKR